MLWIIQNNFYKPYNHKMLIDTLERLGIQHIEVIVTSDSDELIPVNPDTNILGLIKKNEESIIVCGGLHIGRIATQNNWFPGSFYNENFSYNKWAVAYDKNLLNHEHVISTLKTIEPNWSTFFIRPCEDSKAFNGSIFLKDEFKSWRNTYLSSTIGIKFENELVVASPIKEIYSEYRFFVVDKQIITCSQYKSGKNVVSLSEVGNATIEFAQKIVNQWQPSRCFVLDIAYTMEGFKIVELNNFTSSGFYSCNIGKIIESIENMHKK